MPVHRLQPRPGLAYARGALTAFGLLLLGLGALEAHAPADNLQEPGDGGTPSAETVVDVKPDESLTSQAGRQLPPKPEKGWKKPPCGEVQVEINSACWVLPARPDGTLPKPPCPVGLYEHKGRCLQPVSAAARPDTSIEQ